MYPFLGKPIYCICDLKLLRTVVPARASVPYLDESELDVF